MEDTDPFFEMDSDPRFTGTWAPNPLKTKIRLSGLINYIRQQYIDNGIGRWAIVDKSTNQFIGWTGLKLVKDMMNNQTNYYDLGYRLIRKYWGQGIATETAMASLSLWV